MVKNFWYPDGGDCRKKYDNNKNWIHEKKWFFSHGYDPPQNVGIFWKSIDFIPSLEFLEFWFEKGHFETAASIPALINVT